MSMGFTDSAFLAARNLARALGLRSSQPDRFGGHADQIPIAEKGSTEMHRAFYSNSDLVVNKWRHYLEIYDRHLSKFRNKKVRLLEIGVSGGGSLQLWRNYFGSNAVIFGVDINPACAKFDGASGSVRIGSQADTAFLKLVVEEMQGVDIIIDDGSHTIS
jgi:hypothetical protein